jgi:hypothetical protein
MLSLLEIPKGVQNRVEFYRSRFFWESDEKKEKILISKWDTTFRPKYQGDLVLK